MTTFSDATVRTLVVLAVQMTVVLSLGLALAWCFRRKGPAWQTAIYRVSLLATLLLFIATPMFGGHARPALSISAPPEGPKITFSQTKPIHQPAPAPAATKPYAASPAPVDWSQSEAQPLATQQPVQALSLRDGFVLAWLLGSIVLLGWILVGQIALLKIRRRSASASLDLQSMLAELCLARGYPIPELRVGERIRSPFVAGLIRPCIYLPQNLMQDHPEPEIQAVLAHEIAHVQRRDCLWTLISKIYCCLLWPHPLAWVIARKMEVASEELCDQIVIQSGLKRKAYAECLLRIAEGAAPSRIERLVGTGVFPLRSAIGKRISLVLDHSHKTATTLSTKTRVLLSAIAVIGSAGVILLIAGHQTASAQTPASDPNALALLKEMTDAYGSLQSYSANTAVRADGDYDSAFFNVTYKQPGYAKVTIMQQEAMVPAAQLYAEPERLYLTSSAHPTSYVVANRKKQDLPALRWPIARGTLSDDLVMRLLDREQAAQAVLKGQTTLGANVMVDGVECKMVNIYAKNHLLTRSGGPVNWTSKTTLAIGSADHLLRQVSTARGTSDDVRFQTTTYEHVKHDFPVSTAALQFVPSPSMTPVSDPSANSDPDPAVREVIENFQNAVQSANTLSFVVDDVDEVHGSNPHFSPYDHSHLVVQLGKNRQARVKLSMQEYPNQDLEIISDGEKIDTLYGSNARHYLEIPYQNASLFNAGTPVNTFPVALDVATRSTWMAQYLQAKLGPTSTVDGEPADVIVYKRPMHDQYGFPMPSAYVQKLFFSQRTHMLLKTETKTHYEFNPGKPDVSENIETYRDIKINEPIPDSTFKFVPSPGMTPTKHEIELRPGEKRSEAAIDVNLGIGQVAPDFNTVDMDGNPVSLSQFRGKVVFLCGWTFGIMNYSWDLPAFEKLYKKYKPQGLVMFGIPYESPGGRKEIETYLKKNGITYPQLFDGKGRDAGIQSIYKMGGRNFVFIIDRQGKVFAKPFDSQEAGPYIKAVLAQR